MPKPTKGPRLGGSSSHQKALLANLATSLFEHGRIKTTEPKARALRPYAEKLITHAKKGTLHNRREVMKKIRDKDVVHTLFAEIGPFFADRNGGYTRIIKVEARKGDNAPMAVIELVREKTVTDEANRARRTAASKKAVPAKAAAATDEAAVEEATADEAAIEEAQAAEAEARPRSRRRRPLTRPRSRRRRPLTRPRSRRRRPLTRPRSRTRRPRTPPSRRRRPPRPRQRPLTPRPPTTQRRPTPPTRMPTSPSGMSNEPAIDSGGGFVRLRLDIAYDGTDFAGWAVQAGQRTVAGALDDALSTVFRTQVQLRAAGRTDAGVHATGQVAHVDVPVGALSHAYPRRLTEADAGPDVAAEAIPEFLPLVRRLARFLPADVRVLDIGRAAPGFDARFSALRRHYVYRLSTAPYGVAPQEARFVTAWPRQLDVDAMSAASRDLVGLHDFAAFCRQREGATTIRDLQRLDWARDGDFVTAYVTADAFCWSMVRSLVGALMAVGEHRREPGWCATLLMSTRRSSDFAAAPPHGLMLVGVDYPPDDQLQARNKVTRDLRVVD